MIEKNKTTPIGQRPEAGAAQAHDPEALEQLAEDPISVDRDRCEEQKRAFQSPEDANKFSEKLSSSTGTDEK